MPACPSRPGPSNGPATLTFHVGFSAQQLRLRLLAPDGAPLAKQRLLLHLHGAGTGLFRPLSTWWKTPGPDGELDLLWYPFQKLGDAPLELELEVRLIRAHYSHGPPPTTAPLSTFPVRLRRTEGPLDLGSLTTQPPDG